MPENVLADRGGPAASGSADARARAIGVPQAAVAAHGYRSNPERSRYDRFLERLLPQTLLGRLSVAMVAGVLAMQLVGNAIWARQLQKESELETKTAAQNLGLSAASAIRFFLTLPPNYRPLLIQQFREMGGTRFFVNVTASPVAFHEIADSSLARIAVNAVGDTLKKELPRPIEQRIAFAWPEDLPVSDDGSKIGDLPGAWVQHILILKPNPAPIMVIQTELEPGHWLYLAALMPNPYFLESGNPLSTDRVVLHGLSLAAVLLLSILVVRWMTRPLAALSDAADAFGKGESMPALPETGSREFVRTARAFGEMRERIQRYIEERERLFMSISHDLRAPITRLKLRVELLEEGTLQEEFQDDLDELDMMVKGALQCVKDSDIHETPTTIRLDAFIVRMIRSARLAGHEVHFVESGLTVLAKPLALKRAVGNLLDNALRYGGKTEIQAESTDGHIEIRIRDHGPGVPEEVLGSLCLPYVRLEHGREKNGEGLGLGLGIVRGIVHSMGGELILANHREGGLCATIRLPAREVF